MLCLAVNRFEAMVWDSAARSALCRMSIKSDDEEDDAESQEGFETGMKTALEICPTETDAMSMAKLFRALNAYKEEGSDA